MTIRQEVIERLTAEYPYLAKEFGIRELHLFGSVSRGEDTSDSDIDLLYSFEPAFETYHNLFRLHEHLTSLFGRKIDLVSLEWSGDRFLSIALRDAVSCSAAGGA
ncbi:MAG TPA: nucleotidyltransferase domain-containing protein [Methanocorpusculum sp.]|nr:nucleotidyltransferase domain-containing protein [Methanocorpusculum sp.]